MNNVYVLCFICVGIGYVQRLHIYIEQCLCFMFYMCRYRICVKILYYRDFLINIEQYLCFMFYMCRYWICTKIAHKHWTMFMFYMCRYMICVKNLYQRDLHKTLNNIYVLCIICQGIGYVNRLYKKGLAHKHWTMFMFYVLHLIHALTLQILMCKQKLCHIASKEVYILCFIYVYV